MNFYKRIYIIAILIIYGHIDFSNQQVYASSVIDEPKSPGETISNVKSNSFSDHDDECVNNSVENKCSHAKNIDTQSANNDNLEQIKILADNSAQLRKRIKDYDTLDDNKLFGYDFGSINNNKSQQDATENTLRQVLLLHRHGDRTPIQFPPKDPLKEEPFWEFHGYGQLTNRGKARVFLLGKLIRDRYNGFLHNSVNKNQRLSKSSGSLRCIESAQMFLAGFLGLNIAGSKDAQELVWDKNNNPLAHLWQPASIQSVPAKMDGMLAEGAICKALDEVYKRIESSELVKNISLDYKPEADIMKEVLGFEMDHFYKWFWGSSQIEVEREYFENKMNPKILSIYDRMQEAGNLGLKAFQSTKELRRLRTGMLIHDMLSNMKHLRNLTHKINLDKSGDTTIDKKKFIHYSAHDLTIVLILGMLDNWEKFPFRPDYAASLIMELHQSPEDEWFVKIFYMPEVPSKPIELHVDGCEEGHPKNRCTLDRLAGFLDYYRIRNWQTWMKECKNDMSSLDPYLTGH